MFCLENFGLASLKIKARKSEKYQNEMTNYWILEKEEISEKTRGRSSIICSVAIERHTRRW